MSIQPLRFAVAPRFHVRADWPQRLDAKGAPLPVASDPAPGDALLFNLPAHIRALWWSAAESMQEARGGEAYQGFVAQVVEFLQFKQMPLPESCAFDVRVSKPGLRSTRLDAAPGDRRTVARINLGDAATHLRLTEADRVFRLRLEAGEGLWFPPRGLEDDGDTLDKLEIDAVLVLSTNFASPGTPIS